MRKDDRSKKLLRSVYGILFFGVPNQGLNITSLIPMVDGQPNEAFLRTLGEGSHLLRNQTREFSKCFDFRDSEVICFYEVIQSHAAVFVSLCLLGNTKTC